MVIHVASSVGKSLPIRGHNTRHNCAAPKYDGRRRIARMLVTLSIPILFPLPRQLSTPFSLVLSVSSREKRTRSCGQAGPAGVGVFERMQHKRWPRIFDAASKFLGFEADPNYVQQMWAIRWGAIFGNRTGMMKNFWTNCMHDFREVPYFKLKTRTIIGEKFVVQMERPIARANAHSVRADSD